MGSSVLYRVWSEISKVDCPFTRNALFNCKNPEVVKILHDGFRNCFTSIRPEVIKVAKSQIIAVARQLSIEEYGNAEERLIYKDSHLCWSEALERFGIPIIAEWRVDAPIEVLSQIKGQKIEGPLKIKYMGADCILVNGISDEYNVGDTLPEDYFEFGIDEAHPISLTYSEFIDFEN